VFAGNSGGCQEARRTALYASPNTKEIDDVLGQASPLVDEPQPSPDDWCRLRLHHEFHAWLVERPYQVTQDSGYELALGAPLPPEESAGRSSR